MTTTHLPDVLRRAASEIEQQGMSHIQAARFAKTTLADPLRTRSPVSYSYDDTTLAGRINTAMSAARMGTGELARACGVSGPCVSDWRNGKTKTIDSRTLFLAAKALGVNAEWLATGGGDRNAL